MLQFQYQKTKYNKARLGVLTTPHGIVETPNFIFCATKAAIKGLPAHELRALGTQIILSNTYHLMLKPGAEHIEKCGGLQKFTGWNGPMLTDSGGFQIFSLGFGSFKEELKSSGQRFSSNSLLKITEEGAEFSSYYDGSKHFLTPERSIDIQRKLGADIILVLDECTPFSTNTEFVKNSMELSHRWEKRSLDEFVKHDDGRQVLYGIIHGGIFEDFRKQSTDFVNNEPFFGHAIGGSLGKNKAQMQDIVSLVQEHNRPDRPTHLLGIGGVSDIFHGIKHGIDTFDCVHPTRIARHGNALVKGEFANINLKNQQYAEDLNPIEEDCGCTTCQNYSKAYLHHLIKVREGIIVNLLTIHNIYFMNKMMAEIRQGLLNENLEDVQKKWIG